MIMNIHCHNVEIYYIKISKKSSWKNTYQINDYYIRNNVKKIDIINANKSLKTNDDANLLDVLYLIKCNDCDKILHDYESKCSFPNSNGYYFDNKNYASLFCTKTAYSKYDFNNVKCFQFFELNDYFMIGTRDEINIYLCESLNSLMKNNKELSSNNENNLNLINDMKTKLKKEKEEKEEINKKLETKVKEKNSLEVELKNEKSLNLRINETIKELKKEKENLQKENNSLNSILNSEKIKNKELSSKLSNISSENNANVRKVLEQVDNEKSKNEDLSSKNIKLSNIINKKKIENEDLEKSIKEKNGEIQILKNKLNNLGNEIEESKKNLIIQNNAIKILKESVIKEKNINQNLSKNLDVKMEENNKLNQKLDNIAIEHNKNWTEILKKHEKEINSLNKKYEKEKNDISQKLAYYEDLKKDKKNYINQGDSGIKFKSECKVGEYDIILDINSIRDLINNGWNITYNQKDGKETFRKKKDEPTIVVGVIGNKNTGKTFFLEKLSGYQLEKGFTVKTKGLSVRYGRTTAHNIAILDSAGQETPLLNMDNSNIKEIKVQKDENEINNEIDKKEKENEVQNKNDDKKEGNENEDIKDEKDIEFENYSRDKLITEFFIQKFIIWKSDIIILVIGNISLTEQKLLYKVKKEVKELNEKQHKNKYIYVIHNLKEYTKKENVDDYIENTLKKLCNLKLEETEQLHASNDNNKYANDKNYFNKFYMEKDENVAHFIFINDEEDISKYFNEPTISHIQKEMEVIKTRNKFSVIEDCKEFFMEIADQIMEENIKKEDLTTIEEEKCDKILLKNINKITLKSYAINEVGFEFRNIGDKLRYSCYVDTEKSKLYICIEFPGGGILQKDFSIIGINNVFTFKGEKYGDKELENDQKEDKKRFRKIANTRENIKFKFDIKIPCAEFQVQAEEGKSLNRVGRIVKSDKGDKDGKKGDNSKGIAIFEYDIININQKRDKNDDDTYEF